MMIVLQGKFGQNKISIMTSTDVISIVVVSRVRCTINQSSAAIVRDACGHYGSGVRGWLWKIISYFIPI